MSLLLFCALNESVVLLSTQGQKALVFYQKYLNLCSEDDQRSYRLETTWGWVINDRIVIFSKLSLIYITLFLLWISKEDSFPKQWKTKFLDSTDFYCMNKRYRDVSQIIFFCIDDRINIFGLTIPLSGIVTERDSIVLAAICVLSF